MAEVIVVLSDPVECKTGWNVVVCDLRDIKPKQLPAVSKQIEGYCGCNRVDVAELSQSEHKPQCIVGIDERYDFCLAHRRTREIECLVSCINLNAKIVELQLRISRDIAEQIE